MTSDLIPVQRIQAAILFIRKQKVLLDADLAALYGVQTRNLVRAVRRNLERFPAEFMFQLTPEEFNSLRCQIGISKKGRGGRRYPPYAFTEHGVAMLSSILNSKRAIQVNIEIIKIFIRLRKAIASNSELARKLAELETKYDSQFKDVFGAIRKLMAPPELKSQRRLGFRQNALRSQFGISKRGLQKP